MTREEIKEFAIKAGRGCGKDFKNLELLMELAEKGIPLPNNMLEEAIEQDRKFREFMEGK
jgi:hypothetical protein